MFDKSDPLQQSKPAGVTLFLNREGMETARENFFRAYWQSVRQPSDTNRDMVEARVTWDIACAAAVAMFDFMMSGKLGPR